MPDRVTIKVDGREVTVPWGTSVCAAVLCAGVARFRTSASGEARGPLCGMGVCHECRVTIDGREQLRSCQVPCSQGMEVRTG